MDHGKRSHAILAPSKASRWINCPPSARLEDREPDKQTFFTAEGTLAHEISDLKLQRKLGIISSQKLGGQMKTLKKREFEDVKLYHPEMEDYTDDYVTYCMSLVSEMDGEAFVERKIDISMYAPDCFGSVDFSVINDEVLHIVDFKYGKGKEVSAIDNDQMKLYAAGTLMAHYDDYPLIETIRMTIYQPRINNISESEITVDELLNWASGISAVAKQAFDGTGEYKIGEHCGFCKLKHKCRAYAEMSQEMADKLFNDPMLTDEEVLEMYEIAPLVKKWADSVMAYVKAKANDGHQWPGYKMVAGRSSRAWTNREEVIDLAQCDGLSDDKIFKMDLLSPAQMEKSIGKKLYEVMFSDLVEFKTGAPTLVKDSDKRRAINEDVRDMFDDDFEI